MEYLSFFYIKKLGGKRNENKIFQNCQNLPPDLFFILIKKFEIIFYINRLRYSIIN